MAYTSSIDELNNLQTEQDKQKIRAYFEEMDLEPEEIEKRIGVANDLDNLYLMLFLLMSASATAGESVIDDNEYWNDYLTRGYNDVLTENGYNTDDPMVSNRIDETVAEVLNTTYEHIAQTYYLSHDRALMIASNDTNAFANYEYHIRKIKEGYTRKRWVTKVDKKTRHDHVWADGQEVAIQSPFLVGGYEMLFPLDQSLGADAKEVINCRCSVRYLDKKEQKEDNADTERLVSGARITNPDSDEGQAFAESYYPQIRLMRNDVGKIANNTGFSKEDVQRIKDYLFIDKSYYDEELGIWRRFDPDCAIAQSWQRMKDNANIRPHDITLLKHELEEMRIKRENPNMSHAEAHTLASQKYNYDKEAGSYYDNLNKSNQRR